MIYGLCITVVIRNIRVKRYKMRTYTRKKPEVQEIEDVQSRCRLCLGKTDGMISIFKAIGDDVFSGIPLRIGMCLGLEVARDDELPKLICQPCNNELDKFYTFRKNCTTTYRKLKAAIFGIKKVVKNADNESNQKTIDGLVLDNSEKPESVTTNPSQGLEKNEMSIDLPKNNSLEEEQLSQESVSLDENQSTSNVVTDYNREMEDPHLTTNPDEGPEQTYQNQPTVLKNECGFVNKQLNEVNHTDVVQIEEDEKKNKSVNVKTECLPEYIVTALIENGVLGKTNESLEILDQSIKTFNLETVCGSEIVLELVEEESEMAVESCNKSSRSNIMESNLKKDARWCGTCGARFASRGALVRHLRVHSGERPFPCAACGRRFAQREVLRRHELLHEDKLPYQCAWCPKAYTQRGALQAHERAHAPPAARALVLHRCSHCPKVFLYPSGLSRHMSVHQGRDFPCDECPRTFNDKSSLRRHRRVHQRARAP